MMKQTIRNLLLLTAMIIAGAGQVWANQPDPDPDPTYGILGYSSENAATDGGVLLFFNNEDCVIDDNGNHMLSNNEAVLQSWLNADRTVYILAAPDAIHALGADASFIKVEKTTSSEHVNAPRRAEVVIGTCDVTVVDAKKGVYKFTMPEDPNVNVTVTVKFPEKDSQTNVTYINADGESATTADDVKVYVFDGSERELGQDGKETWYVCTTNQTYTRGLIFNGNVNLIIADGSTMTIGSTTTPVNGIGLSAYNDLNIFGQSDGTGALRTNSSSNGIHVVTGALAITNCTVNAVCSGNSSYGIYAANNITINGKSDGTNSVTIRSNYCGIYTPSSVTITNCNVEVTGAMLTENTYNPCSANGINGSNGITLTGCATGNTVTVRSDNSCLSTTQTLAITNYTVDVVCSGNPSNGGISGSNGITINGKSDGTNSVTIRSNYRGIYTPSSVTITNCDVEVTGATLTDNTYNPCSANGILGTGGITLTGCTNGNTVMVRSYESCLYSPSTLAITNCTVDVVCSGNSSDGIYSTNGITINGISSGTNSVTVRSNCRGINTPSSVAITNCNVEVTGAMLTENTYNPCSDNGINGSNGITLTGCATGNTVTVRSAKSCLYSATGNLAITNCMVDVASTDNHAIGASNVNFNGGQLTAIAPDEYKGIYTIGTITIGWKDAEKDFIKVSSYKVEIGRITTAEGQRFVAYIAGEQVGTEVAQAIIEGSNLSSNDINGRTLRPIAGYLVSTTDDNLTIKDNEPKFSIDDNGMTKRYYEFAASTDENPVRVTVEYTIPENEEYKMRMIVVDGAKLETDHGFLMPENDVRMYGEEKEFYKNGDYTYDGEDWKNRIVLICDDPSASLLSAPARRTKAPETIIPVTLNKDYEIIGISKETSDNVYEAVEEAINAGTYKFTVAGLGYFFGTADVELPINRKSISMQNVSISVKKDADGNNLVYTGSALEPVITVKYDANYGGETPDMKTVNPSEYVATVKKNTGTENEPNYVEVAAADFIHSGNYTMFITNLANGGNYDFGNDGIHENFEVEKAYMTGVKYMDWDNEKKELVEKTSDEYTPYWVLEGNETTLAAGHYIASGISNLTNMSALTLTTADVWLVLADDANMIIGSDNNPVNGKGISSDYALTIYGQEKGTGRLMINSKDICIDLSNSYYGKFELYGGHLELNNAYDNVNANALNCYSTEIYGGLLWCQSNGTAIKVAANNPINNNYLNHVEVNNKDARITILSGNGKGIDCFNCTINDGHVNVTSSGNAIDCGYGFTINNGSVFARVLEGYVGNGIQAGGKVSINGGQVTAEGQGDDKCGIICHDGTNLQDIILDWNNASNFVYANSYQGNVKIKSGKYFVEKGGTTVFGSNDEGGYVFANNADINDKTLVPTKNIPAPKADGADTPSAYVPVANNDGNWSVSGSEVKKVLVPYGLNADCSVATKEVEVSGSATLPEVTPLILETKANAVAIDCTGPTSNVNSGLQKILDDLPDTYEKAVASLADAAAAEAAGTTPSGNVVTPTLFLGGDGQQTLAEQVAKTAKALLGATIPENPTPNDLLALAKDFLYFKTETKVNGTATDLVLRAAAVDPIVPVRKGSLIMAMDKMSFIHLMHVKGILEGAPRLGGIYLDLGDDLTGIIEHELLNSYEYSKDGWYTVDGCKLDKQPTAKGLYIRNGRKVVIK